MDEDRPRSRPDEDEKCRTRGIIEAWSCTGSPCGSGCCARLSPVLAILPLIAQAWTDGGWTLAWTVVGAVALVALLVRSWQLRVVTGPGVVVVNWFRTHRLDWREVKRFTAESGGVEVELANGRRVGVAVFATTVGASSWLERRNERAAEQLQRARRRHRDNVRPGRSR